MPRDPNGNYTLPAGNPVVTGTLIESTWANTTLSDIATEMTDSLSRSGKGGVTGPFGIIDFSGSVPGLNFSAEPTSGLKREGPGDVRIQVLGRDSIRFTDNMVPEVFWGGVWAPVAFDNTASRIIRTPPGYTFYFWNSTVPAGFDLVDPDGLPRELTIGGGVGGTAAGSMDPQHLTFTVSIDQNLNSAVTGNTAGHVLTEAQMPRHNHEILQRKTSTNNQGDFPAGTDGTDIVDAPISMTGNDQPHDHAAGTLDANGQIVFSQGFNLFPRYVHGVLGSVNTTLYVPT